MEILPDEMLSEICFHIQNKNSSFLCKVRSINKRFLRIINTSRFHKIDVERIENEKVYGQIRNLALKGDTFSLFMSNVPHILFHKLFIWSCKYGHFDLFYSTFSYIENLRKENSFDDCEVYKKALKKKLSYDYQFLIRKSLPIAILGKNLNILIKLAYVTPHLRTMVKIYFSRYLYELCRNYNRIKDDVTEKEEAIRVSLLEKFNIPTHHLDDPGAQLAAYCRNGDLDKVKRFITIDKVRIHRIDYRYALKEACRSGNTTLFDFLLQDGRVCCPSIRSLRDDISLLDIYHLRMACKSKSPLMMQYLINTMHRNKLRNGIRQVLESYYHSNKCLKIKELMTQFLTTS